MSKRTDVAVKKEGAQQVALASDFSDFADMGFEEVTAEAFAIPFIGLLETLSPQVDANRGEYINGAKAGMLFNNVTNQLFDELIVIPVHWRQRFVEWVPRKQGGGLVGEHMPDDPIRGTTTRTDKGDILPNGNQLVDTRMHFILFMNEDTGTWDPAVINMTSTRIKKSRRWMTISNQLKLMNAAGQMYTPPMCSSMYRMSVVRETNKAGESYHNYNIERIGYIDDPQLFSLARQFRDQVVSGAAKVDLAKETAGDFDTDM